VFSLRKYDHVTPLPQQLHWLKHFQVRLAAGSDDICFIISNNCIAPFFFIIIPLYKRFECFEYFSIVMLADCLTVLSTTTLSSRIKLIIVIQWVNNPHPLRFLDIFFQNGWGFFVQTLMPIIRSYLRWTANFLFNYLQLWRSYVILSATTQRAFRPMVDILSI